MRLRHLTGPVFADFSTTRTRMRNDTYVRDYNRLGHQFRSRRVPYYLVNAHEDGRIKLKVSARHGGLTLVYFDFDLHDFGDPNDVAILAQVVRDHFPGMPEFVVDERGGSGWLVVDTSETDPRSYNALLDRLQTYLRSVARAMGLNIQFVEVKGRVYEHTLDNGWLLSVKAGDLLKAPPSMEHLDQPVVEATVFSESRFDPWPCDQGEEVVKERTACQAGSFRPQSITEEMVENLPALVEWVDRQFPDRPTKTKCGTWNITARAFAELLLTLVVLRPNADGTNPAARHKGFVKRLNEAGVYEYGWQPNRYKCVRDYLSSQGGIDWECERHQPGRGGYACKWQVDEVLREQVFAVLSGDNNTLTDLVNSKNYTGMFLVPVCVLTEHSERDWWAWAYRRLDEIPLEIAA
jgi:hypothetical protein